MTAKTLRDMLDGFRDDTEVMILDGFNGGGCPRTINIGPCKRKISEENANDSADCEGKIGKDVIVIGYGCY